MVEELGFFGFCMVYLPHHFAEPPSYFHTELRDALCDDNCRRLEVIGFRGSAKSTLGSLAYPLYCALQKPDDYPFMIIVADTSIQAGINIANIKTELDNNEDLKTDYGKLKVNRKVSSKSPEDPTLESEEQWQARNMLLNNGVRILARSRGQKVRGLRHRQFRPRLVVIDDPEDTEWIRTKENRDLTEKWLRGEVIPGMDEKKGKAILIGNYLHDDAIMARAKKWGIFKVLEYPLLDPITGDCLWPAKYPTPDALAAKRKELGEIAWQREMLLKVVPEEGQPVKYEDLHWYDDLPRDIGRRGVRGHGVDFAISLKDSADYTAMVHGDIYYEGQNNDRAFLYVLPHPLHAHIDFHDTLSYAIKVPTVGGSHVFFPEDVQYQKAAIQEMERMRLNVHPMRPIKDKLARLRVAANFIKNGMVRFPRQGCEDLIDQLLNFGAASHDDLVDALVYLILGLTEYGLDLPRFVQI